MPLPFAAVFQPANAYPSRVKPFAASVSAHNLVGAGSILLGRNAATFEIWDMVRALDYLQSRPDVLPDRLGVAGNSGGGTQSSYLMALDERVTCAAPSCYLCNLFDTLPHVTNPQDAEQNIFGQVGFGMDHADYVIMRAPKPTLMSTRTGDFFNIDDAWKTFRFAKRIYSRLGMAEKVALIEIEGDHGYCPDILNAGVRWMLRWLAGRDELIVGPDPLPTLTKEEIRSTSDGVMALPDARTTYDLNRDLNAELNETRRKELAGIDSASFAELVRRAAGIRPLTELPAPEVIEDKSGLRDKILRTEPGIYLPLRTEWDESDGDAYRLLVTSEGRRSGSVEAIFAGLIPSEGPAACVELRGWGETQGHGSDYYHHSYFGEEGTIYYLAYLLGKNYVAMRTEDLLVTARWLKETTGKRIELIADSPSAGIVALHAKAVESDLFASVTLSSEPIPTWSSLVEAAPDKPIRLTDTIHGVLNYYDIDDLLRLTGASMSE